MKCTVLPPTARPLLREPSSSGCWPATTRFSSQKSLVCSSSSEANSSSGRYQPPASNATTENPASASFAASVPPPAPVPTMAKSTSSSSRYCFIGTHWPGRSTSGARPPVPRGVSARISGIRGPWPALYRIPWVISIETHAHIAARRGRAAEPDLVPADRMAIIERHDVMQHAVPEERLRRQHRPGRGTVPRRSAPSAARHPAAPRTVL